MPKLTAECYFIRLSPLGGGYLRGVVVVLEAEGEVVVVLVGVRTLRDFAEVVLALRGGVSRARFSAGCGGRVRRQIRVVVRIVRLHWNRREL